MNNEYYTYCLFSPFLFSSQLHEQSVLGQYLITLFVQGQLWFHCGKFSLSIRYYLDI